MTASLLRTVLLAGGLAVLPCFLSTFAHANTDAAWAALERGGHVIVMRHSLDEPGNGDPPGHRFGVCETERQLIPEGRAKAKRVGEALAARGIVIGDVMTSQWCRAKHTAEIAFGRFEVWTVLNVMNPQTNPHMNGPEQTAALRARINAHVGPRTLVLVTHFYNIVPALGSSPAKGDFFVVKPDPAGGAPTLVGEITFH
jgi:phosphohistidine phosphatase SixA